MPQRLQVPPPIRAADRALRAAELTCALIFRCRPLNYADEQARLLERWGAGIQAEPAWCYPAAPDFGPQRRQLESLAADLREYGALGAVYAERALELALEAELAESVATPRFVKLARRRFTPDARFLAEATLLARDWSRLPMPERPALIASDDRFQPLSLIRQLERLVGLTALPFRIEVSDQLVSIAATGERVFLVARGRLLSANDGVRIAVHEVFGHGLPATRARFQDAGLFEVASAGGIDEQEGYAVLCEERAGLLDDPRKRDLAARHLAAQSLFDGATWRDTCDQLLAMGVPLQQALATASRVHRGGGLGRELVYLPALCGVRQALSEQPSWEPWLSAGRLSLRAASVLRSLVELRLSSHGSWGQRSTSELPGFLR